MLSINPFMNDKNQVVINPTNLATTGMKETMSKSNSAKRIMEESGTMTQLVIKK